MEFFKNHLLDPDGPYIDSTHIDTDGDENEVTLDNSSSVNINEYKNEKFHYPSAFKSPLKKLPGKVYPYDKTGTKNHSSQNRSGNPLHEQEYFINNELKFKPKKGKIKFKKYYTRLEWHFRGDKPEGEGIVYLNVGEIIEHYGVNRAVVRDIIPIWGHSSMLGHSVKIICIGFPGLNRMSCTTNIKSAEKSSYFASVCPGIKEDYLFVKKKDVLKIGKKGAIASLRDYVDDNESYPFKMLMEDYDRRIKKAAFKKKLKHWYKDEMCPKTGLEYLKHLIQLSKKISLSDIEEMEKKKWIESKFKTRMDDPTISEAVFQRPEDSYYVQFLSGCPFYEGAKELRYFHPMKRDVRVVSLPRHKQVLNLLKLLKKDQGVVPTISFKSIVVGNNFINRPRYNQLSSVVTLLVCVKVNII